ncbi:MAG: DUF4783 domain-containing protein [Bacteroidia bacterium]|nr:DUF4783 domain-containing protein [Bacteroidia bacterium]
MRSVYANIFRSITLLLVLTLTGFTAPKQDLFIEIESAIAIGNGHMLSKHLNSSVELELPGEAEGIYSKQQTMAIMNRFFDRFPPSGFKIVHRGSSSSGSRFAVGDYTTGEEKTFRVTVFIKKTGSEYLIQEIEFE